MTYHIKWQFNGFLPFYGRITQIVNIFVEFTQKNIFIQFFDQKQKYSSIKDGKQIYLQTIKYYFINSMNTLSMSSIKTFINNTDSEMRMFL